MAKRNSTSETILQFAFSALDEWENGATLDDCLDAMDASGADAPVKPAASSLLFEYFRHKGAIDSLIARFARKGEVRREMRLIIACALTQALYQTGIAAQSAVNIAVDFAKTRYGQPRGAFVNALLRAILSSKNVSNAPEPSFPSVLREKWTAAFGAETAAAAIREFASNPFPAFRLRSELSPETLASFGAEKLDGLGFTDPFAFYEFRDQKAFFNSKLLETGKVYVQDPATALAVSLLAGSLNGQPLSGRVLDACAAPGGKTLMLADLTADRGAHITAADRSKQRAALMNVNFRRAGIRADVKQLSAQEPFFGREIFDLVLADVPCSNTGVIRRRPDAPWRFSDKRSAELVLLQREILDALAPRVKPGGLLLYSTCSVENEEDSMQTASFPARNAEFELVKERLLLPSAKHDGAFAALFRKKDRPA